MKQIIYGMVLLWSVSVLAQENFPVNGVADERPSAFAFTNATLFKDYQTRIENATLLISDGRVVSSGQNVTIPSGATIVDLKGKFIYPAFVDPYSEYGLEKSKGSRRYGPQYESKTDGAYGWNQAIRSYYNAAEDLDVNSKDAKSLRKLGFGAVVSHKMDGIMRGTSAVVSLGDEPVHNMIINDRASAHLSFDKGSSSQLYPTSIMGSAALIRQTYYDARWYASGGDKNHTNHALAAVNQNAGLPQVFEANSDKHRVLVADQIGDEFGVQYIIKGNGDEYQWVGDVKKTNASFILPLNYPDAYDVDDPYDALEISITDLKHWEMAPTNAATLAAQNVEFAFTAAGLKDKKSYLKNIKKSVDMGLAPELALKAMTYAPAKLVRMESEIGSLKAGSRANFIITSDDVFGDKVTIYETWIHGASYVHSDKDEAQLAGDYDLTVAGGSYVLTIEDNTKGKIEINDTTSWKVSISLDDMAVGMTYRDADKNLIRLTGWLSGEELKGTGRDEASDWIDWSAKKSGDLEEKEKKDKKEKETSDVGSLIYPFVAFGNESVPTSQTTLYKNATVWTMEDQGVVENADVLVRDGKIVDVGSNLSADGATVVDATGKHLTPGIIDEHTHIGLSGVNEASHAIVSEVRMSDAIDADDSDIYRQLAGGVTMAQQLHGSANPVGGQSSIIKFKWGRNPSEMLVAGADPYIKFALGENVKQSNRSREWVTRFPQTRMGVEQVYVDGFTRAKAYDAEWKKYNSLSKKEKARAIAPRRDLQLEALAQIVNKERFITCHSYVQSEINMLMKVAEQFDFNVNTFTHILEGYKVADKMADHGVGGSTFSDWWAYKYEVKDAIPYNAALMTQAGVTVAINSDDAEMARRLNQEAAKSVKYGGMDEVEALKMVTINPATLLHLDDRTGSIKAGKDADLVLWSDHPLSVYAKAEQTMIEGVVYFDIEKDKAQRANIRAERARIIAKMKDVKKSGGKTQAYKAKAKHRWDCEEFVDE